MPINPGLISYAYTNFLLIKNNEVLLQIMPDHFPLLEFLCPQYPHIYPSGSLLSHEFFYAWMPSAIRPNDIALAKKKVAFD